MVEAKNSLFSLLVFNFTTFKFHFLYMGVLLTYILVLYLHASCQQKIEDCIRFPQTGVRDGSELPCVLGIKNNQVRCKNIQCS